MNVSIRPSFARPFAAPAQLGSRAVANLIQANHLPAPGAAGSFRALPLSDPGDPIGGQFPTTPTGPTTGTGGSGKAAKESKGFFSKIGSFFKEIGTRMGRGIRDGLKTLVWEPLKKHVFGPIGHKIKEGAKQIGSFLKKLWPF